MFNGKRFYSPSKPLSLVYKLEHKYKKQSKLLQKFKSHFYLLDTIVVCGMTQKAATFSSAVPNDNSYNFARGALPG